MLSVILLLGIYIIICTLCCLLIMRKIHEKILIFLSTVMVISAPITTLIIASMNFYIDNLVIFFTFFIPIVLLVFLRVICDMRYKTD